MTPESNRLLNHWKPERLISRVAQNPVEASWLRSQTSLTGCLKRYCPDLDVTILNEGMNTPAREEAIRLGNRLSQLTWVRTVFLSCDEDPWIYARTVIPNFSKGNPWYSLKDWGKRPLGELLFQMQNLHRSSFEVAEMHGYQDSAFTEAMKVMPPKALGRRSVFFYQNAPLLLTEIFLHFPESGKSI